jgi:hypothetical protein
MLPSFKNYKGIRYGFASLSEIIFFISCCIGIVSMSGYIIRSNDGLNQQETPYAKTKPALISVWSKAVLYILLMVKSAIRATNRKYLFDKIVFRCHAVC